jgi:hypothetical protein
VVDEAAIPDLIEDGKSASRSNLSLLWIVATLNFKAHFQSLRPIDRSTDRMSLAQGTGCPPVSTATSLTKTIP